MESIMNWVIKCKRCGYKWIPRTEKPKRCPNCSSRVWDKEDKKGG